MNTTVINNKVLTNLFISFALCASLFFAFFVRSSDAAVTAWMSPSAIGESSYSCYSGGYVSWTNHTNVYTSNNSYASITVSGSSAYKSYGFQITGFGFNVPAGSRIDGVEASVEGYRPSADNYSLIASIQKNGFGINSSCSYPRYAAEGWSGVESVRTYGGPTELWGTGSGQSGYPLTAAQVNMSDFGIALWVSPIPNAGTWNIDQVQMRVYYTAPPTASGVSASYGSYTRTGSANSPWTLNFTAAGGTTNYQVRTGSTSTTGTQVITGVAADGVNAKSIAYNALGIADGSQTLYLYLSPDGTFWSPSYAFTLLRDDVAPTASTTISTTPSTPTTTSYTVTFTPNDALSTNANEIAYQIRTAAGGAGTLLTSGTSTNSTPKTTASVTDSTLVSGANTRYIRTCDGANNCTDTSFTVTYSSIPTLTTPTNTGETDTTAVLGGNITSQGGSAILSRGICYSVTATNANPQNGGTGVTCVQDGANTATGIFSQTVTGLTANTNTYSYTAYATNAQGAGYSPAGTFRTYGPPITTTSAAGSLTTTSAVLNSTINPNSASTNVSYLWGTTAGVSCALQPNTLAGPTALTGTANLSGATTQATLPSLSANTTYYFCAMATNAYGTTYGTVLNFTTSPTPGAYVMMDAGSALGGGVTDCYDTSAAPCPPTISSVGSATQTSLTVTWSAGSGPTQTSYNLLWCDRTANGACTPSTQISTVTSPYVHNATITCGRTYAYLIRAVNAAGTSNDSNVLTGSTSSCATPPSTPTLSAPTVASAGQINLSWSASTGTAPINYTVKRCTGASCTVSDYTGVGTSTTYSDFSLSCNTVYGYAVYATNAGGTSAATATQYATTSACPSQATGVSATTTSPLTKNTISWNFAANATSYDVVWCSGSACTPNSTISLGNVSSYNHTSLACGTVYRYYVVSRNAGGAAAPSATVQATVTSGANTTCYVDSDNDNYAPSGAATAILCGGCGSGVGYTATQPTTTGSSGNIDCYDGNAWAYPGSSSGGFGFGSNRGDGSFDYNCDNVTSYGAGGSGGSYCGFYESRYYNPGTGCQNNFLCTSGPFYSGTLSCGTQTVTTNSTYSTYSDSFCSVPYGSGSTVSVSGTIGCY